MFTNRRVLASLFSTLFLCSIVCSQETPVTSNRTGSNVTAATTAQGVRFTAPSNTRKMQLEIYSADGQKVFDTGLCAGNVLDWVRTDEAAKSLADGTYLNVVTVKGLSGKLSLKIDAVTIQGSAVSDQPTDVSQLTPAQSQTLGSLEGSESLTVLNDSAAPAMTVIAHDGADGQMIRGRGALTFRVGNFFTGNDQEQMRLTEAGNLGIG